MTESLKYYIWLALALGSRSPKPKALSAMYGDVEVFYNESSNERRMSGFLTDKDITSLERTPIEKAIEIIDRCGELGIDAVCLGDPDYPKILRDIPDPPAVLYHRGRLPDFENNLSVAVVGARNTTSYGKKVTHFLAGSLAKDGVIVVSGGAMGIDSLSHTAALEAGGVTVCVLGCGLNYPYLKSLAGMRRDIAKNGAVVSEYPPDHSAYKYTFPERNRIISGLSRAVLVIEAGEKSGSLITAEEARKQGRYVFTAPVNGASPYCEGVRGLIRSGAKPVISSEDIITRCKNSGKNPEFDSDAEETPEVKPEPAEEPPVIETGTELSREAAAIYRLLTAGPLHIDKIASASGLSVSTVLRALTELELAGLAAAGRGRTYHII